MPKTCFEERWMDWHVWMFANFSHETGNESVSFACSRAKLLLKSALENPCEPVTRKRALCLITHLGMCQKFDSHSSSCSVLFGQELTGVLTHTLTLDFRTPSPLPVAGRHSHDLCWKLSPTISVAFAWRTYMLSYTPFVENVFTLQTEGFIWK